MSTTLTEHRRHHRARLRPLLGQSVGLSCRIGGWYPELNYRPAILDKVGTKYAHVRWPGYGTWRHSMEIVIPWAERLEAQQ